MNLTVTKNRQLDPAQWEIALDLLTVLPLDTRTWRSRERGLHFYDTPEEFFTRDKKWDHTTQTDILEPYYHFRIQFQIAEHISGVIDHERATDLSIVKAGIASALANPLTIANRRCWELDELRRKACVRGDEEQEARYLDEQRHHAAIAYTYYDHYDRERLAHRHATGSTTAKTMSSHQEWHWIIHQLQHTGRAIRTGQVQPLHRSPAPQATIL